MGAYRVVLALMVALSHIGVTVLGVNLGISAVISFYLLSGFVMTALVERHYPTPGRVGLFYIDRLVRLYPQFLFYLFATLALVFVARPKSGYLADITPFKVALNALIAPLNFYWLWVRNATLIPQAWSLGLEVMFYAVVPWLLIFRLSAVAAVVSVAVFVAAYLGFISTSLFGYRLLPGTLFIFLIGSLIYRTRHDLPLALTAIWGICAVMLAATWLNPALHLRYNREVLVGLLVGIPTVWALRWQGSSWLDGWLGDLSYGVFLNHFFVIWLLASWGISARTLPGALLMLAVSVALSFITFIAVERPVIRWRRRLRAQSGQVLQPKPSPQRA